MKLNLKVAKAHVQAGNSHVQAVEEFPDLVAYPTDGPCSNVRVGLVARKSENYQTVEMSVHIEVPCYPGEEEEAAEVGFDKIAGLIEKYQSARDDLLASLQ